MKNINLKTKQSGVALVVGMILLLIIAIIGITSMKSALLQEKMAAGLKNRELADAAALSQLVEAEKYVYTLYQTSNAVDIGAGSLYMVAPRTEFSEQFRTTRNLDSTASIVGFSGINGESINDKFGGILDQEPQFIIESIKDVANESTGTTPYGTTEGEADGNAAGDASGGGSSQESKLVTYRIISKATDTTGHIFSAFESVMTVKTR